MSNVQNSTSGAVLYPALPPRALSSVRTRRICAFLLDSIFIGFIAGFIWLFLGMVTLGFGWFFLPPLLPAIGLLYNGLTISGAGMGTWGMRMMDLEVRMTDGQRVPFLNAAVQAILFWVTLYIGLWPLLASLLTSDKRCLHDIFAGVVVLRRSI